MGRVQYIHVCSSLLVVPLHQARSSHQEIRRSCSALSACNVLFIYFILRVLQSNDMKKTYCIRKMPILVSVQRFFPKATRISRYSREERGVTCNPDRYRRYLSQGSNPDGPIRSHEVFPPFEHEKNVRGTR